MDRRFTLRRAELLADSEVGPEAFTGIAQRLERFVEPFVTSVPSPESKVHGHTYVAGLLSDVARKNTESIAYRHEVDRQVLQRFIGYSAWDHEPRLDELARQVAAELGEADAVKVRPAWPASRSAVGWVGITIKRSHCSRCGSWSKKSVGGKR